jgi:hypothetical protein
MSATEQQEGPCRLCGGKGVIKCKACGGEGGRMAQRLAETAYDFRNFARGRGWETCSKCRGDGSVRCSCRR